MNHRVWLIGVFAILGCRELSRDLGLIEGTPHERYEAALKRAGLTRTGLGADWLEAASRAVAAPVRIELPYRESGFFAQGEIAAAGLEFSAEQGERIAIHVEAQSSDSAQLFMDIFALELGEAASRLVSADSGLVGLELEVERTGDYLVRIQPELLRSVRYTITIRSGPSLGFPVQGAGNDAVKSLYGVDRDGGRRRHEGVDIFAPRATPALAAARGRVVNVGDNELGGLVVWLHDAERNQNLYYAHLDRQIVREGDLVERGDTVGLIGNTGNARTTPPHLHFGIYRRGLGTVDPFPYIRRQNQKPPPLVADSTRIGEWIRVTGRRTVFASGLEQDSSVTIAPLTLLKVLAASGSRYRAELPDGTTGYVPAKEVQAVDRAGSPLVMGAITPLWEKPAADALVIDSLAAGSAVRLLGQFDRYAMVRSKSGEVGWIRR